MATGKRKLVRTSDGLAFRPSLFDVVEDRLIQGDPVGGDGQLLLPEEPGARPYLPSSLAAEAGYSNPTRGMLALSSDDRFGRYETYMVHGTTVTVQRPDMPRPEGVPAHQRPEIVWANPSSVLAIRALHRAEALARMRAGVKSRVAAFACPVGSGSVVA